MGIKIKFKAKKLGNTINKYVKKPVQSLIDGVDPSEIIKTIKKRATKPIEDALTKGVSSIVKDLKNVFLKPIMSLTKQFDVIKIPFKMISKQIKSLFSFISSIFASFVKAIEKFLEIMKHILGSLIKVLMLAINAFVKALNEFGKMFMKVLKSLIEFLKGIFKTILGILQNLLKELTRIFNDFLFYIVCAFKKIAQFHKCIIYYCIDILIQAILIPVYVLFLIFPNLKFIGEFTEEMIDLLDDIVHKMSGFHINQWSNDILNDCYRCENKKQVKETAASFMDYLIQLLNTGDNFFTFTLRWSGVLLCISIPLIYIYYSFIGDLVCSFW